MPHDSHPIDRLVGQNIRAFRTMRKMTQGALGERIGVTFQQIQKYEQGINRVSSSKLVEIAKVLDVRMSALFGATLQEAGSDGEMALSSLPVGSKTDLMILQKLAGIRDERIKRKLIDLIDALAADQAVSSPFDGSALGLSEHAN
jgi:transcriptional regulator with XRE-family HTH domain